MPKTRKENGGRGAEWRGLAYSEEMQSTTGMKDC